MVADCRYGNAALNQQNKKNEKRGSCISNNELQRCNSGRWLHQGKKLTDGDIEQILWLRESGMTREEIHKITKNDYKTIVKYCFLYCNDNIDLLFSKNKKPKDSKVFTQGETIQFDEVLMQEKFVFIFEIYCL